MAKMTILLVSIGIGLSVCEVFFRIIDYAPWELKLYRPGPNGASSFRLKPGHRIVTRFGAMEVKIQTNSYGMRWRDVRHDALGRTRVAFVGDSFTFGLWADTVEKSLVGVFESLVDPRQFEILNFGVPGYGLEDIKVQLKELVLSFKPRHIVLLFYGGNDFLDTYLGSERYQVSRGGLLRLNEESVRTKIPREFLTENRNVYNWLLEKFYVLSFVRHVVKRLAPIQMQGVFQNSLIRTDGSYTSNVFWSQKTYPEFAEKAKDISLGVLREIKETCDRNETQLWIVSVPSIEQVHFPQMFGAGYDIGLPQKYVERLASDLGIPYLDLLQPLTAYVAQSGKSPYHQYDGHWNNEGHSIGGRAVATFFEHHPLRK